MSSTQVAVGVIIASKGKVLLMKRAGSVGAGTWAIPGGKVDFKEDPAAAGARETLEETGLTVNELEFVGYTNDIHEKENLHFVTFTMLARKIKGAASIQEPTKCSDSGWFNPDDLPSPLFEPTAKKLTKEALKKIKEAA